MKETKDIGKIMKEIADEIEVLQNKTFEKWADKLDMDIDTLIRKFMQHRFDTLKDLITESDRKKEEKKTSKEKEIKYKS